jgi:hypothetical protein
MEKKNRKIGNKLIAEFMEAYSDDYKVSTIKDINGKFVKEGDIINANGYNSDITSDDVYLHCVEFDKSKNLFGSNVYGDFDPLHTYHTIEVIGHVEQFRYLANTEKWSGNLPLKEFSTEEYPCHKDWSLMRNVIDKIKSLKFPIMIYESHVQNTVEIFELGKNHYMIRKSDTESKVIELVWEAVVDFIKIYNKNK